MLSDCSFTATKNEKRFLFQTIDYMKLIFSSSPDPVLLAISTSHSWQHRICHLPGFNIIKLVFFVTDTPDE